MTAEPLTLNDIAEAAELESLIDSLWDAKARRMIADRYRLGWITAEESYGRILVTP